MSRMLYILFPCPSLVCLFTLPDYVDCDMQKGFIPEAHTKKMENKKFESWEDKDGHGSQKASILITDGQPSSEVNVTFNVAGTDFSLATLHYNNLPRQHMSDLLFDKSFSLSHNWHEGVVSIAGYITEQPEVSDEFLPDYVDGAELKGFIKEAHSKKMENLKFESRQEKEAPGSLKVIFGDR